MGIFNKLGRRVEELKQSATNATSSTETYQCPACDEAFDGKHERCPECGTQFAGSTETEE